MFLTRKVPEISPQQLSERLKEDPSEFLLLDIRPIEEREYSNIGGDHIPVFELPVRVSELEADRDRDIVVYCRSGHRSASVVAWLQSRGFTRAMNLAGGINAWSRQIDPTVRGY